MKQEHDEERNDLGPDCRPKFCAPYFSLLLDDLIVYEITDSSHECVFALFLLLLVVPPLLAQTKLCLFTVATTKSDYKWTNSNFKRK